MKKKEYKAPKTLASSKAAASEGKCGWYTTCGELVKKRD